MDDNFGLLNTRTSLCLLHLHIFMKQFQISAHEPRPGCLEILYFIAKSKLWLQELSVRLLIVNKGMNLSNGDRSMKLGAPFCREHNIIKEKCVGPQ